MNAGVTVRHTQQIGEILMNKKLVAIMTFVLVALGATMTITSHKIEAENPNEIAMVSSLRLPQFKEKGTISSMEIKQPVKQEEQPFLLSNETKTDDVVMAKEEQLKGDSSLQPLTTEPTGGTVAESVDGFMSYVEQLIFEKVNQEREKAGLSPFENNQIMSQYARTKSQDMGERNYFAHENPEGDLMSAFMQQDGITYQAWGENIAYIGGDMNESLEALAEQFMSNWMNSSGHRANILSTNFSSIGIGVYRCGDKVYATQEFYR